MQGFFIAMHGANRCTLQTVARCRKSSIRTSVSDFSGSSTRIAGSTDVRNRYPDCFPTRYSLSPTRKIKSFPTGAGLAMICPSNEIGCNQLKTFISFNHMHFAFSASDIQIFASQQWRCRVIPPQSFAIQYPTVLCIGAMKYPPIGDKEDLAISGDQRRHVRSILGSPFDMRRRNIPRPLGIDRDHFRPHESGRKDHESIFNTGHRSHGKTRTMINPPNLFARCRLIGPQSIARQGQPSASSQTVRSSGAWNKLFGIRHCRFASWGVVFAKSFDHR